MNLGRVRFKWHHVNHGSLGREVSFMAYSPVKLREGYGNGLKEVGASGA